MKLAKTQDPDQCCKCGSAARNESVLHAERQIDGQLFVAELPARKCSSCEDQAIEAPALAAFDAAVAGELARSGASSPAALRFLRKSLGLTAVELGDLLELRPETISRLEHGKMPADRRTVALLGALVLDRLAGRSETADRLRALAQPPKGRSRVEVDIDPE
jgi:DNA-binding XRE family transcriptional regulator